MNRAFYGAYQKGYQAYQQQGQGARCPYVDKRAGRHDHIVTFSRAFTRYWQEGFSDASQNLPPRYEK